jgi:hypothetical protein
MWQSPSEKLVVAQLVNKLPKFYGIPKLISVFTTAYPEPDEFNPYTPYFSQNSF